MLLGGYQKLTLIDYPGKLAATVFTVGCSFRCPFCHNPELVDPSSILPLSRGERKGGVEKEFLDFLKKRQGKLEGVCITGGEPTIQPDLIKFIQKIKKMGFLVKLDTNGSRPDVLKKLFDLKLVDFVAMDIKNQIKYYDKTTGTKVDKDRIKLSADLIRNSRVPYEFRTTVVPGIHTEGDFVVIAKWIGGAPSYYLQEYRELKILDPKLKQKTKGKKIDLEKIRDKIKKNFGKVGIRK
ncbi:MAG: anaerobic ribonucleoside-triphosphate reductase activating protein [Candidatus Moranbacteria bacterium CG06_land_8_20_14_3_00_40_12]|nr:MAG: anaerobic ribonucleoside-triphosphate reductase activating protein [Candidatus Moranbacteria bacterium CG06_land_8_20_14_3_00_40_12]